MPPVLLSAERRSLHNAAVPTAMYTLRTRAGDERQFRLPERREFCVPAELEARVELRDGEDGPEELVFSGHAAVFDRRSVPLGFFEDFYEVIARGAFRRALDRGVDCRALFNHQPHMVLGRTKANTLDLREDPLGLHYFARSAPTSYATDLRMLIDRGDVDQSSFAFTVERERWEEDEDGVITRTILEVKDLFDVSPVTYPAYEQTDARTSPTAMREDGTTSESSGLVEGEHEAPADADPESAEARKAHHRDLVAGAKRRLTVTQAKTHRP